jgi:hypothetical protein
VVLMKTLWPCLAGSEAESYKRGKLLKSTSQGTEGGSGAI